MGLDASPLENTTGAKERNGLRVNSFWLIIALGASLIVTGCGKKEAEKSSAAAPAKQGGSVKEAKGAPAADESVQHKVLAFNLEGLNEKGTKKWEVKGESAEAVSESEVKLNHIVAKTFGDEAEATITADSGTYDKTKNNVRLEKNVKATITNTAALMKDYANLSGNVVGAAQSKEGAPKKVGKAKTQIVITCDGEVEFDYENNFAYFNKNVRVASDDGTIEADKITVNLDPATKKIRDIVADGNVKISRGENITYSDKATYIEADKKIVLTGKPKLVIYQDGELKGKLME